MRQELSGIFATRIYEGEFTVRSILEQCRVDPRDSTPTSGQVVEGVNLVKLRQIVQRIPVKTIRERRERLNTFYEEVLVSADPVHGLSFHSCLMILAHHNVISDSKSLRLEEFLRRRMRLKRVQEAVRRNTVTGFFDTLYWSREFRRRVGVKKSGRMDDVPQFPVPEILVDDPFQDPSDEEKDAGPSEMAAHGDEDSQVMLSPTSHPGGDLGSPSSRRNNLPRLDTTNLTGHAGSNSPSEWTSFSPSHSPRHSGSAARETLSSGPTSERGESPGEPDHSRQNSAVSVRDVMTSLDNSAWGESLRRSFTQRRSRE